MTNTLRLATLALAGLGLFAQAPTPAPAPAFTELRELLNLTDAQLNRLRQIQTQLAQNNRPITERIATRQQDLRTALDAGTTDAIAIGQQVLDIEKDRNELAEATRAARETAVAVLNDEQRAKLKTLEDASRLQVPINQAQTLNLIPRVGAATPLGF